jgi:NAD(P)-dependent dehydrogenase (short-subunit alcohol dehydrogenase family)
MVSQYVKMLAKQLAPQGVRVNTVSGAENGDDVWRAGRLHRPVMLDADRGGDRAGAAPLSTMPWPATTWADTDASAAVAFLAADESRAITGRHVTVEAGLFLN